MWGQSPVGVSRRHKCARSTHAQPILPRWGQSRGVVSSGMGSVAVTNVHAQRMRVARPAPTRRVGSVPRWGQSPVGVSRRHKCARSEWAYFCNGLRCLLGLAWGETASARPTYLHRIRCSQRRRCRQLAEELQAGDGPVDELCLTDHVVLRCERGISLQPHVRIARSGPVIAQYQQLARRDHRE